MLFKYAAERDYTAMNETLLYLAGRKTTQCLNISIVDDETYEGAEMLLLLISPPDDIHVVPSDRTIPIEIMDDECKFPLSISKGIGTGEGADAPLICRPARGAQLLLTLLQLQFIAAVIKFTKQSYSLLTIGSLYVIISKY